MSLCSNCLSKCEKHYIVKETYKRDSDTVIKVLNICKDINEAESTVTINNNLYSKGYHSYKCFIEEIMVVNESEC